MKESDLTAEAFLGLVDLAAELKADKKAGLERPRLRGKNIALLFQELSTRTRCAFEVAAHDQGAHVTYLGPEGSHFGREESVVDAAAILGRFFDGIEFRGYDQELVEEIAENAGVPVWNGMTDQWHPTQMLADLLTMREVHGQDMSALRCCFTGDGCGNIARSLLVTGALIGADVRIAAPPQLHPPVEVVSLAERLAAASGARLLVTDDLSRAVADCRFIYADVWVRMRESDDEWDRRVPPLTPYQVTAGVMAATGRSDVRFMHCLPAVHSIDTVVGRRLHERFGLDAAEVTHEVFTSSASLVLTQAENKMHTIKAVMVAALES